MSAAPTDVRGFLDVLKQAGELTVVDREVHWDLEVGAVSRRACELDGPAVWFRAIKDYPGHSVLANPIATWRRAALALGLPADAPIPKVYERYIERESHPIPPRVVRDAPLKEVVATGAAADLNALPAPMIHEGDGGRYLGTWCIACTRDADTGWLNWGTYRFMVHNESMLVGWPLPTSHFGKMLLEQYVPRGRPMPVAIAIGADLPSHLAATSTYRIGQEEAALAGGLAGRPVDVIRCEMSDLLVPAASEIVVEAEVLPDRIAQEGPYGEYPGYRSGEMGRGILCRVTAITHRQNPIMTMDCTGLKDCASIVTALGGGVAIRRTLERQGIPVSAVYVPPEGAIHIAVVAVKQGGPAIARRILQALTARRVYLSKIIVVDEDIDVFDTTAVLHALATRCHPTRGIQQIVYEGRAQTLTPCYNRAERATRTGATAVFDATWPPDFALEDTPVAATFNAIYPAELRERVIANWQAYGF
jgi:4-hydroxy-3-polyprenylbenzoate decarboxylase